MKTGLSATDLAQRILSDAHAKVDIMASTGRIALLEPTEQSPYGDLSILVNGEEKRGVLSKHAARQIAEFNGVPWAYVERMLLGVKAGDEKTLVTLPKLYTENMRTWLASLPAVRLIRTFDRPEGMLVRAFLSDKYRPLDNYDLANAVLPKITSAGWTIKSADVTDTRLYIQAVHDETYRLLKPNPNLPRTHKVNHGGVDDLVSPGIVITNSEVGDGSLRVEGMIYRLICTNGLIGSVSVRKAHLGRRQGSGDGFNGDGGWEFFSDETRKLSDAALWAQLSDTVDAAIDRARFDSLVDKFESSMDVSLGNGPEDANKIVEATAKRFELSEGEANSILFHLAAEGDLSQFGLVNAVTRTAQDAKSYDRAVDLERLGGVILDADLKALKL